MCKPRLPAMLLTMVIAITTSGCDGNDTNGSGAGKGGSAGSGGSAGKATLGAGQAGSLGDAGTGPGAGGASTTGTSSGGTGATSGGAAGNAGRGGSNTGAGGVVAGAAGAGAAAGAGVTMSFFVTSDTSATGNLGGLVGADARCKLLATAEGLGAGTWRAYLSAEQDPANNNQPTNARDRIGNGPWHNRNGVLVARNLDELHALKGNVELFIDERGARINGQWPASPTPNQHDILTGSTAAGLVMTGATCESWTSSSSSLTAQVGHSDGLGPSMNPNPPYDSWNSSHANASCADTAPRGGAGKIYCFRAD